MLASLSYLVGEENRRLNLTLAHTGRTSLHHLYLYRRTYTLTRDLHESELTERQHIVLSAITFHQFAYIIVQLLLVAFVVHVDKINNDDAAYISQTELVNQLVCGQHVELERVLLLVLINLLAAGIDINREQCFGFVYDEITTVFKTDRSAEPCLHLTGDVEMVEDRLCALIEFDNLCALGSNQFQIMTHFIIDVFVIDLNSGKIRTKHVSDDTECTSHLFAHKTDRFFLLETFHSLFPTLHQ